MPQHKRQRSDAQVAAQVAVEALANNPDAFSQDTIEAVLRNGEAYDVPDFYMDLAREAIA